MAHAIHINQARAIIDAGKPVNICFWKKDGSIESWRDVVGLRYSRQSGTRTVKHMASREIRTVRDVCIFEVNGMEVFL